MPGDNAIMDENYHPSLLGEDSTSAGLARRIKADPSGRVSVCPNHPDIFADEYVSEHLATSADVINMAINGSSASGEFYYVSPAGKKTILRRTFVVIEDGTVDFVADNFGAISELTNGLEISITPSGGVKTVLENWKTNREIRDTMFDFDQSFKSAGHYTGRWTHTKDLGDPGIVLNPGDKIAAKVSDNLSDLDYLSLRIKGKLEDV